MSIKTDKFELQTIYDQANDVAQGLSIHQNAYNDICDMQDEQDCPTEYAIVLVRDDLLDNINHSIEKLAKLAGELS